MNLSIKKNNKQYELKPYTLGVARTLDQMRHTNDFIGAYQAQWDFLKVSLGEEALEEIYGSNEIEEDTNLMDVTITANEVVMAYEEELLKQQMKKAEKVMDSKAIDKMTKIGDTLATINNLK